MKTLYGVKGEPLAQWRLTRFGARLAEPQWTLVEIATGKHLATFDGDEPPTGAEIHNNRSVCWIEEERR